MREAKAFHKNPSTPSHKPTVPQPPKLSFSKEVSAASAAFEVMQKRCHGRSGCVCRAARGG